MKYVSALFGVCLCSAFWQAPSVIGSRFFPVIFFT